MREWVPVSTSARGRLVVAALRLFGERPFDDVPVVELAAAAGVTTGALYHHFASKAGLFYLVRADVAQRVVDRIMGAASATTKEEDEAAAGLLAAFDFATTQRFAALLSESPPQDDAIAKAFGETVGNETVGILLAAAWRAALRATTHGTPVADARTAITTLRVASS